MKNRNNKFLLLLWGILTVTIGWAQQTKTIVPSKPQLKWVNAEVGVLIHFDMPVFEPGYNFRKDWNYHPDLSIFNPKTGEAGTKMIFKMKPSIKPPIKVS